MSNYYEWEGFHNMYLEDSFVLRVEETDNKLVFVIEIVLTEEHPFYTQPKMGEKYCYKKGNIVFRDLKSVNWHNKNMLPYTDADNNKDYGNIDSFTLSSGGYHLLGDWGEVTVTSSPPIVVWLNGQVDN